MARPSSSPREVEEVTAGAMSESKLRQTVGCAELEKVLASGPCSPQLASWRRVNSGASEQLAERG